MGILSRNIPIQKGASAILFIDVQHYNVYPNGGQYQKEGLNVKEAKDKYHYFFDTLHSTALPNMIKLQQAIRDAKIEPLYTVMESLTIDGRDRSLDYKISGFNIPKDSPDGKVADEIKPIGDEMVFKKSSSSPFISTSIHYILGNLGVKSLIICGLLSDQCISSAVRDACDLGYLVTLVTDACTTYSKERHEQSIGHIKGYCRQMTADQLLSEIKMLSKE
ncbi:MAG: cysteine hydrolase [Sulfurovum sp.]|nr:cysteine hydrolase [Sulfurovum sp.]